jgi:hypothetical protein
MATIRRILTGLVACFVLAQFAVAQQPTAPKSDAPTQAKVRADLHRTMADLIEAQSAEKPDQAKVQALSEKVAKLRGEIVPPAVAAGPGRAWGGPGRGPCGAWGGGPGYGRGMGWGGGPGYGRGMGWGGGPGYGRGMGWGGGYGMGFVDANGNGVCDRFEAAAGQR